MRRDGLAALLIAASVPFGRELARSSLSGGKSLEYAGELIAMGPRVTGSASYQRAAEWSADRFRAMASPGSLDRRSEEWLRKKGA